MFTYICFSLLCSSVEFETLLNNGRYQYWMVEKLLVYTQLKSFLLDTADENQSQQKHQLSSVNGMLYYDVMTLDIFSKSKNNNLPNCIQIMFLCDTNSNCAHIIFCYNMMFSLEIFLLAFLFIYLE